MSDPRTLGYLTMLNVLNAGLGLASTVVVAYFFGTGRAVEVYLAAVGLHASMVSLAQTGQVSEVLLPSYHALRESRGRDDAYRVYTALTNRFLAVLAGVALVGWLLAPLLTRLRVPGFDAADIALAAQMFRWILPLVVLQVGAELLKTLANAERLFGTPEAVSAVARVLSLAALVLLAGRVGTWSLVIALWCAAIAEVAGILWLLRRCGYRYRPAFALPQGLRQVRLWSQLAATLPYVGLTQLYLFVLDAAVSHLAQGSFAVFRYANMIWSRTQGIFLRPVSVTFFTEFSETTARGSTANVALAETAVARVLAIAAIVTTAVLAGARPVLAGVWEGDRFPHEQIVTLVWLLGGLYLLLPVAGVATILRKVTVSLQRVRETYLALAGVQVVSALLAWLLVPAFGLAGALAVSALNLAGFCAAPMLVLRAAGSPLRIRFPIGRAWRWLLAAMAGVAAGLVGQQFVSEAVPAGWGRVADVGLGCLLAAVGVGVAFGLSVLLQVPESRQAAGALARVLGRRQV